MKVSKLRLQITRVGLLGPISAYQKYLSGLKMAPTCRYLPTCSQYAKEAIVEHGAIVGSLLSISRILRCNPLFHGGYHPVSHRDSMKGY
jgi:uncharacterized protein